VLHRRGHALLGVAPVHLQVAELAGKKGAPEEEDGADPGPQREHERLAPEVPAGPEPHLGEARRRRVVGERHRQAQRLAEELDPVAADELLVEVGRGQDHVAVDHAREPDPDRPPPPEMRGDHAGRVGHL
jgi:hypothetical protein